MSLRNSFNIRVPSPDGTMFVHCIEQSPGRLEEVQISIGKSGSSVRAWADALAGMVSLSLKSSSLHDILSGLSSITTDKSVLNSRLTKVSSGPDAVFQALMMYKSMYDKTPIYRPPSLSIPQKW